RRMAHDGQAAPEATRREVNRLARAFSYFHWHLAFPEVFSPAAQTGEADRTTGWRGGFDVVLGNPPWERLKLDPAEWFAAAAPRVARARNAAERARRIDAA